MVTGPKAVSKVLGWRPAKRAARPQETGLRAGLSVGTVGQLQGAPSHTGLDRLEVELVDCLGGYEAGDFGFQCRGEPLLAGFLLTALVLGLSRAWHKSSLTAIRSATRRRRRWHSAICAWVAATCAAGIERLRVLPATDQVSNQ